MTNFTGAMTAYERLIKFGKYWSGRINNGINDSRKRFTEKQEYEKYWNELFYAVTGLHVNENGDSYLTSETGTSSGRFIDIYCADRRFLVEQKGPSYDTNDVCKHLNETTKHGRHNLTPLEQAGSYINSLSVSMSANSVDIRPRLIATCNFNIIRIYDSNDAIHAYDSRINNSKTAGSYESKYFVQVPVDCIQDYENYLKQFFNVISDDYITDDSDVLITAKQAASRMRELRNALKECYKNDSYLNKIGYTDYENDLNILTTRIIFILYAEDMGLLSGANSIIGRSGKRTGYLTDGSINVNDSNSVDYGLFTQRLNNLFIALGEPDYINKNTHEPCSQNDDNAVVNIDKINALRYDSIIDSYHFPFIGDFFRKHIQIPELNENIVQVLLKIHRTGLNKNDFHWRDIDAVMFGSMMEGMFSHDDKISSGIYWTPRKFIHMVIDPVFIREKTLELDGILSNDYNYDNMMKINEIDGFIESLADYRILDPACGSGNFLTETYLTMRRLENKALISMYELSAGMESRVVRPIRVKPSQFAGIEINDYACIVARMSMAIAESRANYELKTCSAAPVYMSAVPEFPLHDGCRIVNHNALTEVIRERVNDRKTGMCVTMLKKVPFDWGTVMPLGQKNEHIHGSNPGLKPCKYVVIGNPPFVGSKKMNEEQISDIRTIYGSSHTNKCDYVTCWFLRASDYLSDAIGDFCFVSTAGIIKGEQLYNWFDRITSKNSKWFIKSAWKQFKWANESHDANPSVVIIHFSRNTDNKNRYILTDKLNLSENDYDGINDYCYHNVDVINEKLENIDYNIKVSKIKISILDNIRNGNKPSARKLIINNSDDDYDALMNDSIAKPFIRKLIGGDELLNGYYRYCIWITNENDYKTACKSALLQSRFNDVRNQRIHGGKASQSYADLPYIFYNIATDMTHDKYLLIPRIQNYKYMIADYRSSDYIPSDAMFTCIDDDGYDFSILSSKSFMKWQSYIGGALGTATRFGKITWNNYPLSSITDDMRDAIIKAGRNILTIRDGLTDAKTGRKLTLAEMYKTMPVSLQAAHTKLDLLVDSVIHDYATGADGSFNELIETRVSAFNERSQANVNNHAQSFSKPVRKANTGASAPIQINNSNDEYTDAFIDLYGSDAVYSDDDRIHDLLAAYKKMTSENDDSVSK